MTENIAHYLASAADELRLATTSPTELGRAIHRDFAAVLFQRATVFRRRESLSRGPVQYLQSDPNSHLDDAFVECPVSRYLEAEVNFGHAVVVADGHSGGW